jgi:inner membrane protein
MDTVTATLLGATAGRAALHRRAGAAGVLVCAAGGLVPDLDALFAGDTLAFIRLHRGPTHSLVGAVVLGAAYAGVAKLLRARAPFGALFAIGVLGNLVWGIGTDVITWWGTQVGWPFTDRRYGWGIVFIIDPWLFLFAVGPWVLWLVRRMRGRPPPVAAFRVATALAVLWVALCFCMRQVAFAVLERECAEKGGQPVDVLPQPLSPFHWNLVAEADGAWRLVYTDLLTLGRVWEERVVPRGDGPAVTLTDATETGRALMWFYHLPYRTARPLADGRTEVVYRDAAYATFLALDRSPPFRYRFVLAGDRIVEEGWIEGESHDE